MSQTKDLSSPSLPRTLDFWLVNSQPWTGLRLGEPAYLSIAMLLIIPPPTLPHLCPPLVMPSCAVAPSVHHAGVSARLPACQRRRPSIAVQSTDTGTNTLYSLPKIHTDEAKFPMFLRRRPIHWERHMRPHGLRAPRVKQNQGKTRKEKKKKRPVGFPLSCQFAGRVTLGPLLITRLQRRLELSLLLSIPIKRGERELWTQGHPRCCACCAVDTTATVWVWLPRTPSLPAWYLVLVPDTSYLVRKLIVPRLLSVHNFTRPHHL
ncbi:hypothetical protein LZ30DRAFT_407046 [Colletotrichum cereale]|nr:hypothetical protein LZ30DRAFT_407046 [Colletotrichum cereale]